MVKPRRVRQALTFAGFAALGLASWLQTSAISRWLGTRLSLDATELAAEPAASARHAESDEAATSLPATTRARHGERAGNDPAARPVADPKAATECKGTGRLALIVAAPEQEGSVAVVVPPDGRPSVRLKTGSLYEGSTVWHIGTDRVWLLAAGTTCQWRMYEPAEPAPTRGDAPRGRLAAATDIEKVGVNEFRVDRSLLDKIVQNPGDLMRVRVVPEQEGGRAAGLRLDGIKPGTLLGMLGLQNGDRLEAINGMSMEDPVVAMGAFARLRHEKHLVVTVRRGGKEVNIDVSVV